MFTPLLVLVVFLILTPFFINRLRMWTQLRLYDKTQRDFFHNRVHFVPEHPTPIAPPIRALYNFIEAEHFIAVLSDPVAATGQKAVIVETLRLARGVITARQQARLKRLLATLRADPQCPVAAARLDEALRRLEHATLIG